MLQLIRQLMTATNLYLSEADKARRTPHKELLQQVGQYVTRLLKTFGVIADAGDGALGFPATGAQASQADAAATQAQLKEVG